MSGDDRRRAVVDPMLAHCRRGEHMPFLRQLVEGRFGPVTLIAEVLLPSFVSVVWNHRDRGALRYIAARSLPPSRAATSPAAPRGGFLLGCKRARRSGSCM